MPFLVLSIRSFNGTGVCAARRLLQCCTVLEKVVVLALNLKKATDLFSNWSCSAIPECLFLMSFLSWIG